MGDDWGDDGWGDTPVSTNNSSTSGPPAKKVKTDDWADDWGNESASANNNTSQAKESKTSDWGSDDWGGSSSTTSASTTPASGGWTGGGGSSEWGGGGSGGGNRPPRNNNSSWGSKPGWGQGSSSATIIKDKGPIQMASMLKIEKMSVDTTHSDIRTHFGRFGTITRLVLEYRFDEERVNCFMDYQKADSAENAIKFLNGKKLKNKEITVMLNPFTPSASNASESSGGDWGGGSSSGGGGFGGGGRGNGRPGGRGCYKCGKEGHMSRECPNPDSGGGGGGGRRGPMKCYKCQGEGHPARDCPQNGTSNNNTASTESFEW